MEDNGYYICYTGNSKETSHYLYLRARVCEKCVEVDVTAVATVIIVDVCFTLGLMMFVYYWSKNRKAKAKPVTRGMGGGGRPRGQNKERPPPVPNPDYEVTAHPERPAGSVFWLESERRLRTDCQERYFPLAPLPAPCFSLLPGQVLDPMRGLFLNRMVNSYPTALSPAPSFLPALLALDIAASLSFETSLVMPSHLACPSCQDIYFCYSLPANSSCPPWMSLLPSALFFCM
ncbi:T-cell surface glycoprotein CD3 epsilon chain isoform X2 [Lemur catta]|nr:T-cell surface glycoprotein CD3 epsilon chain isoform X2 [Lemur catta]